MSTVPAIARRSLFVGVGAMFFSGCGQSEEEKRTELAALAKMAKQLVEQNPRLVTFTQQPALVTNGLGWALSLKLRINSTEPVTADELDAILKDVWAMVPTAPNAIRMTARDGATEKMSIDLFTPAKKLENLDAGPFGDEGVSVIGMSDRYGEWKRPVDG